MYSNPNHKAKLVKRATNDEDTNAKPSKQKTI